MNQLFYNIAGGIKHQIQREKRTTISEVSEILSKIGIGFISNFLLKGRVLFYCSLNRNFFILEKKEITL